MESKLRLILIQVSGAVLFLMLPILISPDIANPVLFKITPFQIDFISYVLLLIFFYVNFFIFIPQFYFKKKYTGFIVSNIVSYAIVAYLPILITDNTYVLYGKYFPYYLGQSLFKFFSVFIFSLLVKVNNKWKRAEEEKRNAELSFLKAQINPHFLFNTLNSIYSSSIVENAPETAAGITKLSGMMRYISSASSEKLVPLSKELEYISDYIDLQKSRFAYTLTIDYKVKGISEHKKVAPLILISFIENAFKHGVNPEEDSSIKIEIDILETELKLMVFNKKVNIVYKEVLASGLGIKNTSNRLKMIYPGRHTLKVENTQKEFRVNLDIQLE